MAEDDTKWYWCLHHERVESTDRCAAALRMGPYASAAQARAYAEIAQTRNEAWEEDDERWHGR